MLKTILRYGFFAGLLLLSVLPARTQYVTNGSAANIGTNCYQLTSANNFLAGSVWYLNKVDISKPFELYCDIYLGCKDADGADGIAFVLQPISTSIGVAGEGLGVQGVVPSFIVEMDTWQNTNQNDPFEDHIAIMKNGVVNHASTNNLAGPVSILPGNANIEDCAYHKFRISWNPDSFLFKVYIDCNLRLTYTGDIVSQIFNNNPKVFWGFTSATGGFNNLQRFCLDYISFTEDLQDAAICRGESVQLSVGSGDSFSWTPAAGLSSTNIANPVATPLNTTTYIATITDACFQQRKDTVTIVVQDSLSGNLLPDQARVCDNDTLFLGTLQPQLGSTFLWTGNDSSPQLAITQPGIYVLQQTNACSSLSDSIQILGQVHTTLTVQNAACLGTATGAATALLPSEPAFSFAWLNAANVPIQLSTGNTNSSSIPNLSAGNYTLLTLDGNGCSDTIAFSVTEPPQLLGAPVSQTNLSCNGVPTGSITLSASGGTPPYQYSSNGVTYQNSPILGGLSAGSFTVSIRDANGCVRSIPVTLTQPPAITGSLVSQVNIACNGGNTGSFTYQASGGTGTLSYSINGSTFQALPQFSGLAAGTYTLTVRDALNCTAQFSVTLTQPPLLSVNVLDQTNIDCNGNATGALSFTGSGGAGAYQFSLNGSPFGSQNTFSGLPSGVYNLSVRDGNACTSNLPLTLTQPETLILGTAGILNIDCFGNSSGAITLNATGGTQPYQFALSGNPLTINTLFDSLASGTYTFVIRDTNQCADTLVQTLVDPPLLTAQVTDRGNVDCLGNATGVLAVAGAGGTFPYTYALTNGSVQSPFQNDSLFTQLYAGIYTLIVRDVNNCLAEVDTLVTTPSGLAAGVDTTIDVACFGDSTGLLQFVAVGGTAPYSYSFDGVTFSLSNVYPNLPALTDTVLLSDANGCLVPVPVEVLQPPLLTGAIVEQANVACNGDSSARIRLTAVGGTPAYQFSADGLGFVNDSLFQGLPSGAYTFVIRDAQGCLLDLLTNISQPNPLVLNLLTQKNIDCFGNENGAITLSAGGGAGAYLFALDTAAFSPVASFSGLPAGNYTVTVRDDSLCLTPLNISITQPDSLILTIDQAVNILCFGDSTGLIGLQGSGGSGTYTYSLNGSPFQTAEPFTGLPAGVYSIVLRDDSACVATADTLLSEPPRLVLTLSDSENVDCFGNANGRIDVSATGGAGGYLFALNGLSPAPDTFFSPLAPGTYFIEVQDLNGCRDSLKRLAITEPPLLELSLLKTDVRCFGNADGSILAIPRGGTPGYRYAWETQPIQTSATATGLPIGTYSVTVTDSNGCTVRGQNTLEQPPLLELFADSIATAFCDFDNGYASVFARGGVPEYTFIWEGTSFTGLIAANITDGTYRVQVTDRQLCTDTLTIVVPGVPPADPLFITDPDAGLPILMMNNDVQFINQSSGAIVYRWSFGDGDLSDEVNPRHVFEEPGEYQVVLTAWNEYLVCPVDYVLTLTLIPDGAIYIANAFTPNGDGVNELFSPIGEGVVQVEWSVYDRWGRRIVTYTSLNERWDGLVRGAPAQEGVYTWTLRATLNSGARVDRAGTVTLLR